MYVAIGTAMIGAIMFGIDCGNFGSVQGFPSFQDEWCKGHFGDAASCATGADGAAVNDRWLQDFVMVASLLLFVGAAAGRVHKVDEHGSSYRSCTSTANTRF